MTSPLRSRLCVERAAAFFLMHMEKSHSPNEKKTCVNPTLISIAFFCSSEDYRTMPVCYDCRSLLFHLLYCSRCMSEVMKWKQLFWQLQRTEDMCILLSCHLVDSDCTRVTIGQFRGKHGVVKVRRLPVHKLNWVKTRSLCYISAFNCLKINYWAISMRARPSLLRLWCESIVSNHSMSVTNTVPWLLFVFQKIVTANNLTPWRSQAVPDEKYWLSIYIYIFFIIIIFFLSTRLEIQRCSRKLVGSKGYTTLCYTNVKWWVYK